MDKEKTKEKEGISLDFEPAFAYIEFGLFVSPEIEEVSKDPKTGEFSPQRFKHHVMVALMEAFGSDYNAMRRLEFLPF